ncbi:MAG: Mur ligase family protein, partial [Hyphomicrobium sp.]
IAVTGSSGKTTTVSLLSHILSADFQVRTLADRNSFDNAAQTLRRMSSKDHFVVLELATERPGQLERVTRLVKPDISIVTLVALEHQVAFRSVAAVAEEKAAIVRGLSSTGLAILNADDTNVRGMAALTSARTVLFGTSPADYDTTGLRTSLCGELALAIRHGDRRIELETNLIGAHNWLAVSAAVACALEIGVSPQTIADRVATFQPVVRRLSLHRVPNGPTFLLDTAKAPYHSLKLPLETLKGISAVRKRFVLGQISDYAGNSTAKYRDAYRAAREAADEVIFIGATAHKACASDDDVAQGKFRAFATVEAASAYLKDTVVAGEIILVKSASNLHLERLLLNWVDAVHCWPNECGNRASCFECNRYRAPFSEHGGRTRP